MLNDGLAARAAAAAQMLLLPPDTATLAALAPVAARPLDLEQARQDFYDFLCVPQSGCYLPPYAHVLAYGEWGGEYWHFSPPRFDGGDALRAWYDAAGFNPAELQADPLIAGGNRPLDHAGFVFSFLAALLEAAAIEPCDANLARDFLTEHLGGWVDLLAELLGVSASPYLTLFGEGLREFILELRAVFATTETGVFPDAAEVALT